MNNNYDLTNIGEVYYEKIAQQLIKKNFKFEVDPYDKTKSITDTKLWCKNPNGSVKAFVTVIDRINTKDQLYTQKRQIIIEEINELNPEMYIIIDFLGNDGSIFNTIKEKIDNENVMVNYFGIDWIQNQLQIDSDIVNNYNLKEVNNLAAKKLSSEKNPKFKISIDMSPDEIGDFIQSNIDYYSSEFASTIESKEFYFQKAREVLYRLKKYDNNNIKSGNFASSYEQLDFQWRNREGNKSIDFLKQLEKNEPDLLPLFKLISRFFSYVDEKAWRKKELNEYDNKRVIARAFVRQHHWIEHFLKYALNGFQKVNDGSGKSFNRVIDYLEQPETRFNILSDNHMRLISECLLGESYIGDEFQFNLLKYFKEFGLICYNLENSTFIYTSIIYDKDIKEIWNINLSNDTDAPDEVPIEDDEVSETIKASINNDGLSTEDLLNIENDVRSLALTLASKDIKPPIAISLFGAWGSGKSFFIEQLEERVSELSKHQAFMNDSKVQRTDEELKKENAFCKGIAQIKFNAWSYNDSSLWAGLVSSIFDKLDEYISSCGKGQNEIIEIRHRLQNELEIFASEKFIVKKEKEKLEEDKKNIKDELNNHLINKQSYIDDIAKTKLSEIVSEIANKSKVVSDTKEKLTKYGFTEDRIKSLSPTELYQEAISWSTFLKNLLKFSICYKILFAVAGIIFVLAWADPNNWISGIINNIGREITAFVSFTIPILSKLYNSFHKYKNMLDPLTEYKNQFNKEVKDAKFEFEQKKELLEFKIRAEETAIAEVDSKLIDINQQIEELEYTLKHFVAKRAFNSFIQSKVANKEYDSYTGLISVIRKDFEKLSYMFNEAEIERNTSQIKINEIESKGIDELFKNGRSLDRIILYIDDLDRCTEDKVLEVIQAVHLLMAFPLFNVVVGVDKRCLDNALIHKNIHTYGQIAPLPVIKKAGIKLISSEEYLEKIFQIPLHLKEPNQEDIKGMISSLLENQIEIEQVQSPGDIPQRANINTINDSSENSESKITESKPMLSKGEINKFVGEKLITPSDLKLSPEELIYLREVSVLVGSIPRAIKRFINIYRIIRAHQDLDIPLSERKESFLSIMFLVAINIGQYKDKAHLVMKIIKTNLSDTLRNDTDNHSVLVEIWDTIDKNDHIKDVLDYPCANINKYTSIVNRFSFGGNNV
ncbi:MAG: KAP family NTPase [Carboxylicivirga sp.]|jgi:hypothetical protein|nr:KAP family NTPase [Carboxylicivirga sp.]